MRLNVKDRNFVWNLRGKGIPRQVENPAAEEDQFLLTKSENSRNLLDR